MEDHKCGKEDAINDMKQDNEKMFKAIYGNGRPGLLTVIAELSVSVKSLSEAVPKLEEKISVLTTFKDGEVALKKGKMNAIRNWGMITGLLITLGIAWFKPSAQPPIIVTDVQVLREAMREEKNITVRGGSITDDTEDALNAEIKSINK